MNNNLFQNDRITGNSLIGFEFKGQFKDDESILINKLKDVLNRNISFSNVDYKLLEPTDSNAILIQDGKEYEVKTPMYSYFEAVFILPKLLEFLKSLQDYKNSYLYFRFGFNEGFCDISQINIIKFILEFNEDYVLKVLSDNTKNGNMEKLTDIKPDNLESCNDSIYKQFNELKYNDDDRFGISFNTIKLGYITFKYAREINYRNKWEEIIKCINHTIITIYNTCTVLNLDDDEQKKISEMSESFKEISQTFVCYEMFKNKYQNIKLTSDLNSDISVIDIIFPSIKDKLFDIVVKNNIKNAEINYDTDVSRLQLKNLDFNKCYYINGVDIVDSDIKNCTIKDCDIYDTNIDNSTIIKCNLFGYSDCKDTRFKDSFVSRNIQLKDCVVTGNLGKMGGSMKGGKLKDTTVIVSMAEIDDDVEKNNVNEIQ